MRGDEYGVARVVDMGEREGTEPSGPAGTIVVELLIALVAAGLAWLAVPAQGVVMHWNADGVAGWSLGAAGYATVTAVATFLLGHFISLAVAAKTGFLFTWLAPAAAGVFWVAYAAFERLWPDAFSFVTALTVAVLGYFLGLGLKIRRTVDGENPMP